MSESVFPDRNPTRIARARWWLLPHIGFYCDGTDAWRWWMRFARWAWIALGWLPGSDLYEPIERRFPMLASLEKRQW